VPEAEDFPPARIVGRLALPWLWPVAHAAAEEDHGPVEQSFIAVLNGVQLIEEIENCSVMKASLALSRAICSGRRCDVKARAGLGDADLGNGESIALCCRSCSDDAGHTYRSERDGLMIATVA